MKTAVATAIGIALVVVALRDIVGVLFPYQRRWSLSRVVMAGAARLSPPRLRGPAALAAVVASWATLLALGFAFIYWPHVPGAFVMSEELRGHGSAVDALYVSLVSLSTLGFGDITPRTDWLQLVMPAQAMLGFGLLTATVSWLMSLHPVLSRRRALAYEVALLRRARVELGVGVLDGEAAIAEETLGDLHRRLTAVERDLVAFPVTHYFIERDPRFDLRTALPDLRDLADRARAPDTPPRVRLHATVLHEAIDDFVATTARASLPSPGGVAERSNAPVLKTGDGLPVRGFESRPLRRPAGAAEGPVSQRPRRSPGT